MGVLVLGTDARGPATALEEVSDCDLVDGAGQVILELLKSGFGEFDQMEILDTKDLKRAVGTAQLMVDGDGRLEQRMRGLNRALHLLETGYYRNLLLEERDRVGRIDYRFEAMRNFKERIQRMMTDGSGLSGEPPSLAASEGGPVKTTS
jgi:hypothetical protein